MRSILNFVILTVAGVGLFVIVNEGAKIALAEQAAQAELIASCIR